MMKQKRQRRLLAWADTNVAMVRNMDGRRWDRNRMLTLLAATLLLAVVAYWSVTLSAVAPAAARPSAPSTAQPSRTAASTSETAWSSIHAGAWSPSAARSSKRC